MAKGKREVKKTEKERVVYLRDETRHWIFAILLGLAAIFLTLAAFHKAGMAGGLLYTGISSLFGWGYFLFPFILLTMSALFFRAMRPTPFAITLSGAGLLFVSGLGILDLAGDKGGFVGDILAGALVAIFDVYASLIILVALFIISLLMTFDTTPPVRWFIDMVCFWRQDDEVPETDAIVEPTIVMPQEPIQASSLAKNAPTDPVLADDDADDDASVPEKKNGKKIFSIPGLTDTPSFATLSGHPYIPPPLSLLKKDKGRPEVGDIKANANIIKRTLMNFGIDVEMDEVSVGPSVTRYALKPAQGVKLARIVGLQNDLALALAAHPLRIEAPIPGKSLVGIEIPNTSRTTVGLASLLGEQEYQEGAKPLLLSLGRSVTGKPYFGSLAKMPHLLIAGTTGSGKSVAIHTVVSSLLYRNSPDDLRFIMIDPKRVELTLYNKIHHLLTPVITDAKKAILALKWATKEMDRRYDVLESESVRDIASYHKNIVTPAHAAAAKRSSENAEGAPPLPERMPYIVIIIDELADIMGTYPRELEASIVRLAQMSRAVGIHLILSTQRPSVNVITGLIKANVPARIAFQVASQTDSRTIIDMAGAEKLLGAGDMLYSSGEMSKPIRLQSAFISENEIKKVVEHIAETCGGPEFATALSEQPTEERNSLFDALEQGTDDDESEGADDDDLYEEAREIVVSTGKASTTFIQRKLRIGYARAARLMDILEEHGVVGPANGAKGREVLGGSSGAGYGEQTGGNEDNGTIV